MPIRFDEQRSKPTGTLNMQVIVIGDKADELTSVNTRNDVLKYARAAGFPARGLGGIPSPYPVDRDGKTDDELVLGRRPIDHWEAEYNVSAGVGV